MAAKVLNSPRAFFKIENTLENLTGNVFQGANLKNGSILAHPVTCCQLCYSRINQVIRQIIQKCFEWISVYFGSYNNVALAASSLFSLNLSAPSFVEQEIEPIKGLQRKIVHFHCGIYNDHSSVVEGGECLHATLDKEFTVQPHWIHSANVVEGLVLVSLQKINFLFQTLGHTDYLSSDSLALPSSLLKNSILSKSIEYEVQLLSKAAKEILKQDKEKLKQLHVTFSNGGHVFREALKLLPREERNTIILITIGSTVAIEENLACKVYNVIGDKDQGSITCNTWDDAMGIFQQAVTRRRISQQEVEALVGGHYFQQPQYQECIKEIIQAIESEYEIFSSPKI